MSVHCCLFLAWFSHYLFLPANHLPHWGQSTVISSPGMFDNFEIVWRNVIFVKPTFLQVNSKTKQHTVPSPSPPVEEEPQLKYPLQASFLHWAYYHMNDIPARFIGRFYDKHCSFFERMLGISPPKICYHRPKNIEDMATQARLYQAEELTASHYMGEYQRGLDPWTPPPFLSMPKFLNILSPALRASLEMFKKLEL